jgi:hypothetical protein
VAALERIALKLGAVTASHVPLQFVDLCCLPPPHDIQGDRLVGVAAEAFDFEVEIAGVQRIGQRRGGLGGTVECQHAFVPSLAGKLIGSPASFSRAPG